MVAPVQDGGVDELPEPVRRRLDEVFGEVLPSTSSDERDDRPDPRARDAELDAELLANRPPHHDQG
jgi:hypothetical protein